MVFYRGYNCRYFGDKDLFYVLFVRSTSIHVAGDCALSASGVGLVPIVFQGSPTLYSFVPVYWTPNRPHKYPLLKRPQVV